MNNFVLYPKIKIMYIRKNEKRKIETSRNIV